MQGYDRPHYTNVQMPFPERPPHVPEDNPTGIYRRRFRVPRGWRGRRVVLHFGGVEGVLYVLVNGEAVGLSKDSRTPAEFDVTEHLRRRRERAPRRRRALVRRELRRGSGPVVARRHLPRRLARVVRARVGYRCLRPGWARRRVPARAPVRGDRGRRGAGGAPARPARQGRPRAALLRLVRGARALAAAVVGGVAGAVHAGARRRRGDRLVPDRLPARGDPRPPAARERQAGADQGRQPPRARRRARPGRHAGVDGGRHPADEALQRQRRAHVPLPGRPLLARPVRPPRALRRRRGERRVPRLLRRPLPRPALLGRLPRADAEHGRARQEPPECRSSGRSATRAATARTTTRRPGGSGVATRPGRCTTKGRSSSTGRADARPPTSSARCTPRSPRSRSSRSSTIRGR